jgi:large subunit ribosomal protein L24
MNDRVQIVNGNDSGKIGKIIEIDKLRNVVKVQGCKLRKLTDLETGKTRMVEKYIHYSNVNLVDPILNLPTRITTKYIQNEMLRISKKSGCVIPIPESSNYQRRQVLPVGNKDTSVEVALHKSYDYKKDVERMKEIRATMKKYNFDLH